MIRCRLAVCAESVVRDASTNNVSALNILEMVSAHKFPILVPKLFALFMLVREQGDSETPTCSMSVSVSGEQLNAFPINVNFQGKLRNRVIAEINGLVIPKPGILRVSIIIENQESGWWEIEVAQKDEPKVQLVDQG